MDRRKFIYSTAVIAGAPAIMTSLGAAKSESKMSTGSNDIMVGVIRNANNPEKDLKVVKDLGFRACQLQVSEYSPELAGRIASTLGKYELKPVSLICMGPGVYKWNFIEGPSTIGLVPRENRQARVDRLMKGIEFCKAAGIPAVHAHFGFLPEDPKDILYTEFLETMKPIAEAALKQGLEIHFETGQETPVTLLRTILDIGTGNLFVNYDTANLVMYGKSNPVDGLKVIGKYVKALHAKDGMYPTDPMQLGKEVPIPTGEVNFPEVIASLKKLGFGGSIIIEYELGESKNDYILKTKKYLEDLIKS